MNGIINVLKPPGMTSHHVVSFLRRLTGIRRIGHTGTLDPGAAGVLPACIGKATRVSEFVLQMDKVYRAELTLGQATDTEDVSGAVIAEQDVVPLSEQDVKEVLASFLGPGTQIPPMYSAVKIDGKKLYELARQGKTIDRAARNMTVYRIELLHVEKQKITFDVCCSRGTYVRTLCREIAEKLGTVGHMSFLLRTAVGPFTLQNCYTLEELESLVKAESLTDALLSADTALGHMPAVYLTEEQAGRIKNGGFVQHDYSGIPDDTMVRAYDSQQQFLAVARVHHGQVKPEKVFL